MSKITRKMNRLLIILVLLISVACSQAKDTIKKENSLASDATLDAKSVITESYELVFPKKQDGLLILFPCFPCNAENTKNELDILDVAIENNIAVLLMNFNQHLWLSENQKQELESIIIDATTENNINTANTFIGGFSSGGNVSLFLSDYFKSTQSSIQPKGVFIVDSPIDLLGLYKDAKNDIEKNFSEVAIQEATWIVNLFDSELGVGDTSFTNYENKSPYLLKTRSLKNLSNLKDVKIRLYSEPDTLWWKEERQVEYENMNAYHIAHLAEDLTKLYGENSVNYIQTENKGYRANGERHPHSWAIVDTKYLVEWMLKE